MPDELVYKTASELLALYRSGETSPVEVTTAVLEQIDRLNPKLNAYRFVDRTGALDSAKASERRWMKGDPVGLVDGIPTSIKDSHYVKGWSTLHGSRLCDPKDVATYDSPHVARLREHGAVFLGKTNLCEQGWKCVGDSPLTGITRNPWNEKKTSGGSSAGAAVCAAAGMGTMNMGGDGGGSIRAPASFCGVVGIKPTYGRVPRYPQESLIACAHFGPLTRTVSDSALTMNVISLPDDRDFAALPCDNVDYLDNLDIGISGLKIGYCDKLDDVSMDPEVADICRKAATELCELGASIDEVDIELSDTFAAYKVLNSAYQVPKIRGKSPEQLAQMDPKLVANAKIGKTLSAYDLVEAGKIRADWIERLHKFFEQFDLLVTPTLPVAAFDVGRNNPESIETGRGDEERLYCLFNNFLYPFNYTHNPAASVPCGLTADGLPVGLQIVGPLRSDRLVLRCCRAIELHRAFEAKRF